MKDQFGVTLSYDEKSVAWLDDYIAGSRATLSRDITDNLIDVLGSFFGRFSMEYHNLAAEVNEEPRRYWSS